MIWYDAHTREPVAPGSCEDGGIPSIEGYNCHNCNNHVAPAWDNGNLEVAGQIIQLEYGSCPKCNYIMLTNIV